MSEHATSGYVRRNGIALAAAVLLVSALSATAGCAHRGSEGVVVSTSLPLASWVQTSPGGGGKGTRVFFPELEIYDKSGAPIYSSHEPAENARVLRDFFGSIQGLQPKAPGAPLAEVLERLPELSARRAELLGRNRISVLSVFLEGCHACAIQEEAVSDVQRELLDRGVNLLVVRVDRPAP